MSIENLYCNTADGMMTQGSSFPGANGKYPCTYIPDVEYAKHGDRILKLQIIRPDVTSGKFPLIVYVKGSSWLKQKLYRNIPKLSAIAQHGFVIAEVEYRESPEGSYADKVEDVKTAIRFMREMADEYCVNSEKVALFGDSSGGHIALMAAMTDGMYKNDLYSRQSEKVCCVADFFGVTDIVSLMEDFYNRHGNDLEKYLNDTFFKGQFQGDVVQRAKEISPIYNVKKDVKLPPVLIVHGDADRVVGFDQSARFARVLQENHQKVYLYKVMGADHDTGIWGEERTRLLVDFFNSFMK